MASAALKAGDTLGAETLMKCCVAEDAATYAAKAVRLASDASQQQVVRSVIRVWGPKAVFERHDAGVAWSTLLTQISTAVPKADVAPDGGRRSWCMKVWGTFARYIKRPAHFLWDALPVILRPRSVIQLPSLNQGATWGSSRSAQPGVHWFAYMPSSQTLTNRLPSQEKVRAWRQWLIVPVSGRMTSRPMCVIGPRHAIVLDIRLGPELALPSKPSRGSMMLLALIWQPSQHGPVPVLAHIQITRGCHCAHVRLVERRLPLGSSNVLPGSHHGSLLIQETLVPQHAVQQVGVRSVKHRSALHELAGKGDFTSSFCCTMLSARQLQEAAPQRKLFGGEIVGGLWLGIARRARSGGQAASAGDDAPSSAEPLLHAFYLLRPQPPFDVLALSVEFCLALSSQAMAVPLSGALLEGFGRGFGDGQCEPDQRVVSVAAETARGGRPRLLLAVESGGRPVVVGFPLQILGPLLHPVSGGLGALGLRVHVQGRR